MPTLDVEDMTLAASQMTGVPVNKLGEDERELREMIEEFRAEELEHKDTGLEHDAEATPGYRLFSQAVKAGSRAAIWLSTRV